VAARAAGHREDLAFLVLVLEPAVLFVREVFGVRVVVARAEGLRHGSSAIMGHLAAGVEDSAPLRTVSGSGSGGANPIRPRCLRRRTP
jgi:hypothetical protein